MLIVSAEYYTTLLKSQHSVKITASVSKAAYYRVASVLFSGNSWQVLTNLNLQMLDKSLDKKYFL